MRPAWKGAHTFLGPLCLLARSCDAGRVYTSGTNLPAGLPGAIRAIVHDLPLLSASASRSVRGRIPSFLDFAHGRRVGPRLIRPGLAFGNLCPSLATPSNDLLGGGCIAERDGSFCARTRTPLFGRLAVASGGVSARTAGFASGGCVPRPRTACLDRARGSPCKVPQ